MKGLEEEIKQRNEQSESPYSQAEQTRLQLIGELGAEKIEMDALRIAILLGVKIKIMIPNEPDHIFGLLHEGHAISATIMGIVFVLLYKLTRSLVVPIIFHMIWNMYAVLGLVLYVQGM